MDYLRKEKVQCIYFYYNDDPQFLNNKSSILVTNCIVTTDVYMIHNTDDGEVVKYSLIIFYELIPQRNVKFIDFCQLLNL